MLIQQPVYYPFGEVIQKNGRGLGLKEHELEELIVQKAGLWLDAGAMFGKAGAGFWRINVACPRATLRAALERLADVV